MAQAKRFPVRVHILMAREAPLGVAICRGPSKEARVVLWDRATDTFQEGGRHRGRIYERRCDLSPNGELLLYFATAYHTSLASFTAIARAPELDALTLWRASDTYCGGGLFQDDQHYWLNENPHLPGELQHDRSGATRVSGWPFEAKLGADCASVYYHRLLRDGWRLDERQERGGDDVASFTKDGPGGWRLRKEAHARLEAGPGKSIHWDEHGLEHPESSRGSHHPDWEWADVDADRLVYASRGCLYSASAQAGDVVEPTLLYDFNRLDASA